MRSNIIKRIEKETGIKNLVGLLAEQMPTTDLHSLLMSVFSAKAQGMSPADLLQQYCRDRFVQPNDTPFEAILHFEQRAFQLSSPQFDWLELSPVAPLGCCSIVATVHQDKVLSAIRQNELVADCTNVMALEAAVRRKKLLVKQPKNTDKIRLCTSHRMMRMQPLPGPGFLSHFKIFGLCTAGRDEGSFKFEVGSLLEHLSFYLHFLRNERSPFHFEKVAVLVTILEGLPMKLVEEEVFSPLKEKFPNAGFTFWPDRPSGRNYYQNLSFQINASTHQGIEFNLVDGGSTDWTAKLLSNRKERLFISAIGSERVCRNFCKTKSGQPK